MSGSSSISTSRSSSPGPGGGGYVRTADDQTGRLCIPGQEDEINQNLINQENSLNGHIAPRSSHSYSMQNQGYAQRREPMPDRFGGGGGGGGGYGGGPGRGGYDRFGGGPGRREEDMFPEPDPDKLVEDIYSTVQIKNLSRNVTEEHIKEVFSSFGKILCIDYPVEITAQRSSGVIVRRGYAFVDVDSKRTHDEMIEKNGWWLVRRLSIGCRDIQRRSIGHEPRRPRTILAQKWRFLGQNRRLFQSQHRIFQKQKGRKTAKILGKERKIFAI